MALLLKLIKFIFHPQEESIWDAYVICKSKLKDSCFCIIFMTKILSSMHRFKVIIIHTNMTIKIPTKPNIFFLAYGESTWGA